MIILIINQFLVVFSTKINFCSEVLFAGINYCALAVANYGLISTFQPFFKRSNSIPANL